VTAYIPGYPIDKRSADMRRRAADSYIGDFEYFAGRIIARSTGERVILQDDNSAASMADIRIAYEDRPAAYVEVVVDIDRQYAAMANIVRGPMEIPAPGLGRVWWVTLSSSAHIRSLTRDLLPTLTRMQLAGEVFDFVSSSQDLKNHKHPDVKALGEQGVTQLGSRDVRGEETGRILIYAEGAAGPAMHDWAAFNEWLSQYLRHPERGDVCKKLYATDAPERHVFVGLALSTPWLAYHTLMTEYNTLPSEPPVVPPEITHVWAADYMCRRCIAWFPEKGWFDPATCWATD
jgi:hypothetical protein